MKTLYTQTGRATARKNQENLLKITLDKNLSSKEHLKRLALRLNLTEVGLSSKVCKLFFC